MKSPEKPAERIPVLDDVGREFERTMADGSSTRVDFRPIRVALPALAVIALVMALTPPGRAIADRVGEFVGIGEVDDKEAAAAVEEFCGENRACVMINGYADQRGGGSQLVTPGQALAGAGLPPSECPEAAVAYEAAGISVDAFIGRCPDPATWPNGGSELPPPIDEIGASP